MEGGNVSWYFAGSVRVLCNRDIFSSGSMVEEVTFQGKRGLKKSYHILNVGHSRRSTAAEDNICIKCFCEGKGKHDTIIPPN